MKDFAPTQLKKGVKAGPWAKRAVFKGTFIDVNGTAGGHVFKRNGKLNKKSGRKNAIEALWGPSVPREMVRGASEEAFHRVAEKELPIEVERAIKRVTKGVIG